jgi:hypothetical protein
MVMVIRYRSRSSAAHGGVGGSDSSCVTLIVFESLNLP